MALTVSKMMNENGLTMMKLLYPYNCLITDATVMLFVLQGVPQKFPTFKQE